VATVAQSPVKSFKVENININKIYVRNTGGEELSTLGCTSTTSLRIYDVTPSVIGDDMVGTITIYDFLKEDDMIRITSPSGFSTLKRVG
jgi:hypothetical protein